MAFLMAEMPLPPDLPCLRVVRADSKEWKIPIPLWLSRIPRGCGCSLFLGITLILILWAASLGNSQPSPRTLTQVMTRILARELQRFVVNEGRLPLPSGPIPLGGDRDTDTAPSHGFTAMLMGKESGNGPVQNPQKTDYLEGIQMASHTRGGQSAYRHGLIFDPKTASYGVVDAYGTPYRIRLDANNDNQLTNPDPNEAKKGRSVITKCVIIWSAGKDKDWNTWDDNLKSWD